MNPSQIEALELTDGVRRVNLRRACNQDTFHRLMGGSAKRSYESILKSISKMKEKIAKVERKLKKSKTKLLDFDEAKRNIHAKHLKKMQECKDTVAAWEKKMMDKFNNLYQEAIKKVELYTRQLSDLNDELSQLVAQQMHTETNLSTRKKRQRRVLNVDHKHVRDRTSTLGDNITPKQADVWSSHYDW